VSPICIETGRPGGPLASAPWQRIQTLLIPTAAGQPPRLPQQQYGMTAALAHRAAKVGVVACRAGTGRGDEGLETDMARCRQAPHIVNSLPPAADWALQAQLLASHAPSAARIDSGSAGGSQQ
jgi:hypothetical protein